MLFETFFLIIFNHKINYQKKLKMNLKILLSILFIIISYTGIYAQSDIQIGTLDSRAGQMGGVFDYSSSTSINIKVQLWGYVRYSGYYIVPLGTSINELISFAGGPLENARLDDVRVTKIKEGAQTKLIKYNYNDMVYEDEITSDIKFVRLEAGDIIVVPGEPRYYARENIAFYLGIVTTLASLTALILSILSFNN
jgi:hypothetical protein